MNRLKLDWSLNLNQDRSNFINDYLNNPIFQSTPPTEDELDTMAKYILWGKDPNTGLNSTQSDSIELETRNSTWSRKPVESLDALLETPTFNENIIVQPNSPKSKSQRIVFDRTKALQECPQSLRDTFLDLFKRIDTLDLTINYYDLAHDKRKNPPRPELLREFTESEIASLQSKASRLNQYSYLKMRHLLVELRREQFTIKDSYSAPILLEKTPQLQEPSTITFDAEIPVLPCGLRDPLCFQDFAIMLPSNYTECELEKISKYYWNRAKVYSNFTVDFRDLEHVYNLFLQFFELDAIDSELDSTTNQLLETLKYYTEQAELSDVQRDILDLKMRHCKNQLIADTINAKYDKSYTANYISTIFRQKIIVAINEAACYHESIIQSLPQPEEFKQCSTCGRWLLRDARNFVRKTRAKDGLAGRCKVCDKKDREWKKQLQEERDAREKQRN